MCRAISLRRLLLLLLQLSQLLAVTQGKTLVLGKEGESAELPCESSQKKITVFTWKFSDQRKILGQHGKGVLIRVTFSPGTSLLQGQSLTLTLDSNSKVSNPLTECKHKKGKVVSGSKVLSMSNLRVQDSDFWNCTVTLDQKKNWFGMTLSVLGFQSTAITAYKSEGESAEFSFPLNFAEENGWGELMWKAEKDSFFQPWISFSIKNKEVSVQKSTKDLKLQLKETLPLTLKIPQVSLQFAGSGNLTLTLDKGTLHQEVNLVVMKVLSRGVNQTVFLACVLGGSFGFLGFLGLCILCCVRCRHQQRQAARMSQIKRLLSEKKTCQCPHRMQKSHNLI